MKAIQIKLSIDPSNPEAIEALQSLFAAIGGGTKIVSIKGEDVAVNIKAADKVKEAPKVKETPKPVEQTETTLAGPAETIPSEIADKAIEVFSTIKLEDIRDELGKKINEHRDAIKNKLTELGAKNVSSLEAKHFEAMYEFLKAL